MVRWWLEYDTPCTPEQMSEMLEELIAPSVRAALGEPE